MGAAGDCVAKDAKQYLAAYAHFEGEYVALMVAKSGACGYPGAVAPARIVALALGPDDSVLCYGRVVVLRGRAAAVGQALCGGSHCIMDLTRAPVAAALQTVTSVAPPPPPRCRRWHRFFGTTPYVELYYDLGEREPVAWQAAAHPDIIFLVSLRA